MSEVERLSEHEGKTERNEEVEEKGGRDNHGK